MAYSAEISRSCPGYFIFLIDQSGSMSGPQGGSPGKSKAESVADAINRIIQNLIIACSKREGVNDYFCVSVFGYGGHGVGSAFQGGLKGQPFATSSQLDASPARIEARMQKVPDGAGGLVEVETKFPTWFDAAAGGGTPMCEALAKAYEAAVAWVSANPAGYPPIILNLTDGEATDGDPSIGAQRLTTASSQDGNALLFNLHISSESGQAVVFPSSDAGLTEYARLLYGMSSELPASMVNQARRMELKVSQGSRGFVYNADIVAIINFLEIGTRPANLALQ